MTDHDASDASLELLKKVQSMLEVESALTRTMAKVEPWLPSATISPQRPRVRPIPKSMEEVDRVLCVARNLAARTSAPAGWSPNAPLVGFSTPNPLPHQLRGGALAALQLERARAAEREKKRQRLQQQEESKRAESVHSEHGGDQDMADSESNNRLDPKRREVSAHEHELDRSRSDIGRSDAEKKRVRVAPPQQQVPQQDVSMNLSDSSSEEEEDDED